MLTVTASGVQLGTCYTRGASGDFMGPTRSTPDTKSPEHVVIHPHCSAPGASGDSMHQINFVLIRISDMRIILVVPTWLQSGDFGIIEKTTSPDLTSFSMSGKVQRYC